MYFVDFYDYASKQNSSLLQLLQCIPDIAPMPAWCGAWCEVPRGSLYQNERCGNGTSLIVICRKAAHRAAVGAISGQHDMLCKLAVE